DARRPPLGAGPGDAQTCPEPRRGPGRNHPANARRNARVAAGIARRQSARKWHFHGSDRTVVGPDSRAGDSCYDVRTAQFLERFFARLGKTCKACFLAAMRPSRSPVLLLCLACTLLLASSCGRRETPVQAGIRDQVLLLGNGSEPRDLDPHIVVSYNDFNIVVALFEGLTGIDEGSFLPIPATAE